MRIVSARDGLKNSSQARIRLGLGLIVLLLCIGCRADRIPFQPVEAEPRIAKSSTQLVQYLAEAYRDQSCALLGTLLANDPDNNAEFLFILDPAANSNEPMWGYVEETRIHQRMFEPENIPAGQTPVPLELRLTSVGIALTKSSNFKERVDLYFSQQNPEGLDPAKWKAMDAVYATDVLFDLQGDIDFQVTGRANFVVIEDLTLATGDSGKFLFLQWNELASKPGKTTASDSSWSQIKKLYR